MDFKVGDPVVYRVTKSSPRPGPRAENVHPSEHGETYRYQVEKFWRVKRVLEDGRLLLYTRRGKERTCDVDDPNLRKAGPLKRLFYRHRFPNAESVS